MLTKIRNLLRNDHGSADVFLIGMIGIIMLFGMGFVVVNYGFQSANATETNDLTTAIVSRAQSYASTLNQSLATPLAPSLAQQCTMSPSVCTTITSATTATNGLSKTLTIVGAGANARVSITRSITIDATQATHVASLDSSGNPTWVNSGEGNDYLIWGVAPTSVQTIAPSQPGGPASTTGWVSSTTRSGVDSTGHLWVWGANGSCQAGTGNSNPITAPTEVSTGGDNYSQVVATPTDEFALDSVGDVYAWGENEDGDLGLGVTGAVCTPQEIPGHHFTQIATAGGTTFGIDINGDLWAWGDGTAGALGNGSTANVDSPVQIATGTTFIDVATDGPTTYAIDSTFHLWSWGANASGQLGVGTTTAKTTAAKTAVATEFTYIAAGQSDGYAIDTNGHLWAWGANTTDQIGDGTTTTRLSPVEIATSSTFTSVDAGNGYAFAINAQGRILSWGQNNTGQLGNGTTTTGKTPAAILPDNTFRSVDATIGTSTTDMIDQQDALWGIDTAGNDGLWASGKTTTTGVPIRMPAPTGFGNPTWG